jgi:ribose/xylose/arabinose/galactoside ABC-type transport system permease subunit
VEKLGIHFIHQERLLALSFTDSTFLTTLADSGPFGLSNLAYIFLALALLLILAVGFTPWGLRLYAVGAFRQAALAASLRVRWYIAASYLLSRLCGSVGAILSVALLNESSTGSAAILLSVVVSSLLGVVFSARLVPTIGGTFMSVLFIGFLINGFQLTNGSKHTFRCPGMRISWMRSERRLSEQRSTRSHDRVSSGQYSASSSWPSLQMDFSWSAGISTGNKSPGVS